MTIIVYTEVKLRKTDRIMPLLIKALLYKLSSNFVDFFLCRLSEFLLLRVWLTINSKSRAKKKLTKPNLVAERMKNLQFLNMVQWKKNCMRRK